MSCGCIMIDKTHMTTMKLCNWLPRCPPRFHTWSSFFWTVADFSNWFQDQLLQDCEHCLTEDKTKKHLRNIFLCLRQLGPAQFDKQVKSRSKSLPSSASIKSIFWHHCLLSPVFRVSSIGPAKLCISNPSPFHLQICFYFHWGCSCVFFTISSLIFSHFLLFADFQ